MAKKIIEHQLLNGFSFKLCRVEGGSFQMGSDDYKREQPIHLVHIPSFYLAEYPVTQEFWSKVVVGENPSNFIGLKRPVESITWFDAAAFCNQLNLLSGYTLAYFTDKTLQKPLTLTEAQKIEYPNAISIFSKIIAPSFRLPSEAEWEYAARGGQSSGHFTYAGGDKLDEVGWYRENSHGETKEVGLKLPNELGLYDMSGNVWEWCEDQFHSDYQGAPKDESTWLDLEADASRVLRGGGWSDYPNNCRPSDCVINHPAERFPLIGFRVLLFFPPCS